ncbi:flagellar hook-basal body complex protein [Paracoccaceae bacterium GXU_MW_L88]
MDIGGYIALSRQSGLLREMDIVANNIANISTGGFRKKGMVFSEMLARTGFGTEGVAMAGARTHYTAEVSGGLKQTSNPLDMAIEGDGYFQIETLEGPRLTRAGAFLTNPEGDLVTADGARVLDAGGAPIFIPPDATNLVVGADGTISANGQPVGQVGVFAAPDPTKLVREDGVRFRYESEIEPTETSAIRQGFLETSNVDPISEIARMIEIQRNYELGQKFLDREDERIRSVTRTLGQL